MITHLPGVEPQAHEGWSDYLEYVALERDCSPATQRQALNAIVFLARHVYGEEQPLELKFVVGSGGRRRPPTVFSREEVKRLLSLLDDPWRLMAEIHLHVMKRPGAGAPSPLDFDGDD